MIVGINQSFMQVGLSVKINQLGLCFNIICVSCKVWFYNLFVIYTAVYVQVFKLVFAYCKAINSHLF